MKTLYLLLITLCFFIQGCDEKEIQSFSGTYSGKFIYDNPARSASATVSDASVTFSEGSYKAEGNPDKIPAGGSGTFSVAGKKVKFSDENMWTAEFDWGLILNGSYDYKINKDSLILTRQTEEGIKYQYRLKRTR